MAWVKNVALLYLSAQIRESSNLTLSPIPSGFVGVVSHSPWGTPFPLDLAIRPLLSSEGEVLGGRPLFSGEGEVLMRWRLWCDLDRVASPPEVLSGCHDRRDLVGSPICGLCSCGSSPFTSAMGETHLGLRAASSSIDMTDGRDVGGSHPRRDERDAHG